MIPASLQDFIKERLSKLFGNGIGHFHMQLVGGGSINQTFRFQFSGQSLFCKINSASKFPHLFQKEKSGLELIQKQNLIKVPAVIDCFEISGYQILLMDWIHTGERTEKFWKNFGQKLAALHQVSDHLFGLENDNYMGSVPQSNKPFKDWSGFFIEQRLQPLVEKCADRNLLSAGHLQQVEKLYHRLPNVFPGIIKPVLVHGDLWSGNFICNENSDPVLIDPAVYYGHASVDLGMSTLFGGFHSAFYEAYHYHSPFPENYKEQWMICNLYPLLIHLYLFGRSYLAQIERTLLNVS